MSHDEVANAQVFFARVVQVALQTVKLVVVTIQA